MATKQIGWFTLKEDREYIDNGYECAAWYEKILVRAGKYPMEVVDYKEINGSIDGHTRSAFIRMHGTIVCDDFGSRLCGVPVGEYDIYQNKGKQSKYNSRVYLFILAENVLNDPDSPYELLPEFEAKEVPFEFDGEMHKTYEIRVKE